MKQVIQNFKTGELHVDEVPQPSIPEGMVLGENRFSLISAGTERGTVRVAQAGLIDSNSKFEYALLSYSYKCRLSPVTSQ
jgi:hypothetical protein